jgi:hypothetical protein
MLEHHSQKKLFIKTPFAGRVYSISIETKSLHEQLRILPSTMDLVENPFSSAALPRVLLQRLNVTDPRVVSAANAVEDMHGLNHSQTRSCSNAD